MSNSRRPDPHPRRWATDPAELEHHPLGVDLAQPLDVLHACPAEGCGVPPFSRPLCPCCFGAGLVTGDRLERYVQSLWQAGEPDSIRVAGTPRRIEVEPI